MRKGGVSWRVLALVLAVVLILGILLGLVLKGRDGQLYLVSVIAAVLP